MEKIITIFVSLFSFSTILLLSSQCQSYAVKKAKEFTDLLSKDRQL